MTERLSKSQINSYRSLCWAEYVDREREEGEFNTISCLCDMALELLAKEDELSKAVNKAVRQSLYIQGCSAQVVNARADQIIKEYKLLEPSASADPVPTESSTKCSACDGTGIGMRFCSQDGIEEKPCTDCQGTGSITRVK